MDRIYSVEDIKARIDESIDYYKAAITAWEKVIRMHKKNGDDYSVFTHNFSNITFDGYYGKVYFRTKKDGYTYDDIEYTEDTTPDECEQMIRDRLSRLYEHLADEKRQMIICDAVASEFIDTVNTALKKVKEAAGDGSTLVYACEDYMRFMY